MTSNQRKEDNLCRPEGSILEHASKQINYHTINKSVEQSRPLVFQDNNGGSSCNFTNYIINLFNNTDLTTAWQRPHLKNIKTVVTKGLRREECIFF